MSNLLDVIVRSSLTMSLVVILFLLIHPLIAKKYSAKIQYYTWLIIVIGFIIPFRPNLNLPNFKVTIPKVESILTPSSPPITTSNKAPNKLTITSTSSLSYPFFNKELLYFIWVLGCIGIIGYHINSYYYFRKTLRRWNEKASNEQILLLTEVKNSMHICKKIQVKKCPIITSPMLIGFINPIILLPLRAFSKDELSVVFKHELVHLKRGDLWYKSLVLLATALHWFNPVVWIMSKTINLQCEASCDEEVIQGMDEHSRWLYGKMIVDVVQQSTINLMLSTNFYGGKKEMKKRILSILNPQKKKWGISILVVSIIFILSAHSLFSFDNVQVSSNTTSDNVEVGSNTISDNTNFEKILSYSPQEKEAIVLAVKTKDYEKQTVADFNHLIAQNIDQIAFSLNHLNPNQLNDPYFDSVGYSCSEIGFEKNGASEASMGIGTATNRNVDTPHYYGCSLEYTFSWKVIQPTEISVAKRDSIIHAYQNSVQLLLDTQTKEELQNNKQQLQLALNKLSKELSCKELTVKGLVTNYNYVE